jgi:hypothetical protein
VAGPLPIDLSELNASISLTMERAALGEIFNFVATSDFLNSLCLNIFLSLIVANMVWPCPQAS